MFGLVEDTFVGWSLHVWDRVVWVLSFICLHYDQNARCFEKLRCKLDLLLGPVLENCTEHYRRSYSLHAATFRENIQLLTLWNINYVPEFD